MKQIEVLPGMGGCRRLTAVQERRVQGLRALVHQYETQAALAEACMMDPSYISQLLNGHRPMGERTARCLERELSLRPMSLDELAGPSMPVTEEDAAAHSEPPMAPLLEWGSVKAWLHRSQRRSERSDSASEGATRVRSRAFRVTMYDCSMTSHQGLSVPEGYRILVDPAVNPVPGNLVVAEAGRDQCITLRQLVVDPGGRYLRPLNPAFEIYQLRAADSLLGVAIEV